MLVAGLVIGNVTHTETSASNALYFLAPLVAGGLAAQAQTKLQQQWMIDCSKGIAAVSLTTAMNMQKDSDTDEKKKARNYALQRDTVKCAMLVLTTLLANNSITLQGLKMLPYDLGSLFTDKDGIVGFGTVGRNVLVYQILKEACCIAGLLDAKKESFRAEN